MWRDVTSSALHSKDGLTEDEHCPISKTNTHTPETCKIRTGEKNKVPSAPKAERHVGLKDQRGKIKEQGKCGEFLILSWFCVII